MHSTVCYGGILEPLSSPLFLEYFRIGAPVLPLFKVDRSGPPH